MVPNSPVDALSTHADGVRDVVVEVIRARHDKSSAAHLMSESRYGMGFGTQWRDLLDDTNDAFSERGFQSYTLRPGGHLIPVVNDCLVYVWRVPDDPDAVKNFAASPTRQSGFLASPPHPMLWEPSLDEDAEQPIEESADVREPAETAAMMAAVGDPMPLVLVMVHSTPRQLQAIEWAVAELDDEGKVQLHDLESIFEPEFVADEVASDVESFDSGTPVAPVVEVHAQERPGTDA